MSTRLRAIPYRVVHCTSSDDQHTERELEKGRSRRGWHSARFCDYPQELVLRFDEEVDIREIRVLSHQSKIAAQILVSVGRGPGLRGGSFESLGYMRLDPNERSNFNARELKKVHVNTRGSMLKLSIQKSHINRINHYNQVALMAIEVLGSARRRDGRSNARSGESGADSSRGKGADARTKAKIKALLEAKKRAVAEEDYARAKKIKLAIEALEKIGPHLAMLERKKKEAVEREDFDTASAIKEEIQRIRTGRTSKPRQGGQMPYPPQGGGGYPPQQGYGGPYNGDGNGYSPSAAQRGQGFPGDDGRFPPDDGGMNRGGAAGQQPPYPPGGFGPDGHQGEYPPAQGGFPPGQDGAPPQGGDFQGTRSGPFGQPQQYPTGGASPGASPQVGQGFPANRPGYFGPDGKSPHPGGFGPAGGPDAAVSPQGGGFPANQPGFGGGAKPFPANQPGYGTRHNPMDDRPIRPMKDQKFYSEDRPLPALAKKGGGGGGMDENPFGGEAPPSDQEPQKLSEKDQSVAAPWIPLYGENTVRCLFDNRWVVKERGIKAIIDSFKSGSLGSKDAAGLLSSCVSILKSNIDDKIIGIGVACSELFLTMLTNIGSRTNCDRASSLVGSLFKKLGSGATRVRQAALNALTIGHAKSNAVAEAATRRLLKPLDSKDLNKPVVQVTRGELLLSIIKGHKLNAKLGLTVERVMPNAVILLENRDGRVRDIGMRIISAIEPHSGLPKLKPYFKNVRQGIIDTLYSHMNKKVPGRGTDGKGGGGGRGGKASTTRRSTTKGGTGDFTVHSEGKGKSPKAGDGPAGEGDGEHPPGYCQFCEFHDPSFDEVKMDIHYWSVCPMLISCPKCEEVVEVASYTQHCLETCEKKNEFVKCKTCNLAFAKEDIAAHRKTKCKPQPKREVGSRCPLCLKDIPPWEEGWKQHLIDNKCPCNKRTNGTAPPAEVQ